MGRKLRDNLRFKIGQQVEAPELYPGVLMTITDIKLTRESGYFFTIYRCDWADKPPAAMDAFYAHDLKAIKGAECDVST